MGANPLYGLRVNAVELTRQPGAERTLSVDVDADALGIDDERVAGPLRVRLTAISNADGIVITGTVSYPWHDRCRRCLIGTSGEARSEVTEMYQHAVTDPDAYAIEGDQIDLAPVVREYALLSLPDGPLCRPDCAGICAACGTDLNRSACDCDTSVRDNRWAALDDLKDQLES